MPFLPPLSVFRRQHLHGLRGKIPIFRIFYSSTFLVATLVLASLLLISPGDHIYQSFKKKQIYHIVIVAGVYVLTFLVAIFIYASRLFKTRSALAAIPREIHLSSGMSIDGSTWKSERALAKERLTGKEMALGVKVNRRVESFITSDLKRSALITYEGRPRDLSKSTPEYQEIPSMRKKRRKPNSTRNALDVLSSQKTEPIWGHIAHPGWSSPSSADLPNLHYESVIVELSNLIEAKAVSLAPIEPLVDPVDYNQDLQGTIDADQGGSAAPLDPFVVDLLQRPISMGLRDYIAHLTSLGMIPSLDLGGKFLALYERARFSGSPLNEPDFRALMNLFAELLRSMSTLDDDVLEELRDVEQERSAEGSSVDEDFSPVPEAGRQPPSDADTESLRSSDTVNHYILDSPVMTANEQDGETTDAATNPARTAESTSKRRPPAQKTVSGHSIGQSLSGQSNGISRSSTATSSKRSLRSSNAESVIRLAEAGGPLNLPYTFGSNATR